MSEFKVQVVNRNRKYWYLRYTDPVTGERHERSSGCARKRDAIKAAGQWEAELVAGVSGHARCTKWADFRRRYEEEKVFSLRESTANRISAALNMVEQTMKPDDLRRINRQWITQLQRRLLKGGDRSLATVESHCRHLKAALNWAKDEGLIASVPKFPRLKQARTAKLMKGRPITGEEFDRMIRVAHETLDPRRLYSVCFLLNGLWLSGLRIGEAMDLTWDQWADGIRVDVAGEFVFLLIPGESEKGGRDRTYPVTPDFAKFLLSVPAEYRMGHVFNVRCRDGRVSRHPPTASAIVKQLGKQANVKVDEKRGKSVFASPHDLRRSFGFRWSRRVSPMDLKDLMRHATVVTTEKYYVGINAEDTARRLATLGDTSGDTSATPENEKGRSTSK